jgi:hypothetical protein
MMSHQGVPVEEISRLAGHANSRTTEVIYRRELRPVITTGAEIMDQIFHCWLTTQLRIAPTRPAHPPNVRSSFRLSADRNSTNYTRIDRLQAP